ncbi:MAG: ComEA family DNA-binding protein [Lawsonibacter sp.]
MAGISRYEKVAMGMTGAFLLLTTAWFFSTWNQKQPYEVVVSEEIQTSAVVQEESEQEEVKWPESLLDGEIIDLNQAQAGDLERLPGIGEKRAQDILAYREAHGPFTSVEELDQVPGIGEGILAGLRDYVTVGPLETEG